MLPESHFRSYFVSVRLLHHPELECAKLPVQRIVHIQSPVKNAYQSNISGVKIRKTGSYNPRNITHAAVIKSVTLSVLSLLSSSNYSCLTVICANRLQAGSDPQASTNKHRSKRNDRYR